MFTLKFYEQNLAELQSIKDGKVDIERKEAIRYKMQLLRKDMTGSQAIMDKSDPFFDSYFKMREEPSEFKLKKPSKFMDPEENERIEEDLSKLKRKKFFKFLEKMNKKVIDKILRIPEDQFQIKPDFLNLKSEIHDTLENFVNQSEKIKLDANKNKNFMKNKSKSPNGNDIDGFRSPFSAILNKDIGGFSQKMTLNPEKKKKELELKAIEEKEKEKEKLKRKANFQERYDFRKLNETRWGVNQNNILEVQKLPKEIDKISQLKSDGNQSILKSIPINFGDKKKIQMMMDDMKTFISTEDEIHMFSCVFDPEDEELKNHIDELEFPFYLHLSSLSRELISSRKNPEDDIKYDQKVFDFMSEKDYQISPDNITYETLLNIISGRLSEKILYRVIAGQELYPLFEENPEENAINLKFPFDTERLSFQKKQKSVKKSTMGNDLVKLFQKKSSSSTKYPSSMIPRGPPSFTSKTLQELYEEVGYPIDQLQHDVIDMNNIVQSNYISWQDNPDSFKMTSKDPLAKIDEESLEIEKERKKKLIFGDNKFQTTAVQVDFDNDEKSSVSSENLAESDQNESDDKIVGFREQKNKKMKKSVDLLLKEISELKEAKRNSLNMVDTQMMMKFIAEINLKIEKRLKLLLNLIMETDIPVENNIDLEVIPEMISKDQNISEKEMNNEPLPRLSVMKNSKFVIENSKKSTNELPISSKKSIILASKEEFDDNNIIEDEKEVKRLKEREKMKIELKSNLKYVVKDIDKLQGKFIDGHLKTKLLFQFLKEYRKLQEEKQSKILMESNLEHSKTQNVENPFGQNLLEASVKDQNENYRFKRAESKNYTYKNGKPMLKGWGVKRNNQKTKTHIVRNTDKKGAKQSEKESKWIGGLNFNDEEFNDNKNWNLLKN